MRLRAITQTIRGRDSRQKNAIAGSYAQLKAKSPGL